MTLGDAQLLRYGRHVMLNEIGVDGQVHICAAKVVVVGVGGLGCPAAVYLAAAGVGEIVLIDDDKVELANLQRQFIYSDQDARDGTQKVHAAVKALGRVNPAVRITPVAQRAGVQNLPALVAGAQVVVDGSDNYETRLAVNGACQAARIPLVSGAAERFDGQVLTLDFAAALSPCYACLFPPCAQAPPATPCALLGIFAPLAGAVGALMAGEALKLAARGGADTLHARLLAVDLSSMRLRTVKFAPDPACTVCGGT